MSETQTLTIHTMLNVIDLSCVRGERSVFTGVDFKVEPGEWLHVRGANGCGKTSLLRLLTGLSRPVQGEIRWCGKPTAHDAQAYRADLLFLGHQAAVKEELTALENLQLGSELDGRALPRPEALAALQYLGLKGREDQPVRSLSAGQKRRVLLSRLVTRKAKLWLLDEPFAALDTRAVEMLGTLIGEHLDRGGMAVVTSHQAVQIASGKAIDL